MNLNHCLLQKLTIEYGFAAGKPSPNRERAPRLKRAARFNVEVCGSYERAQFNFEVNEIQVKSTTFSEKFSAFGGHS
jgi:hypothetical protein